MFHRIKDVQALPDYKLNVTFLDDSVKTYSVAGLFDELPVFTMFEQVDGLFDQVHVDTGGYGVVWNAELDLSCDELWEHGELIED